MILGMDISHWQDDYSTPQHVDFIKAQTAGANYVFIKASQGVWVDRDLILNWENARIAKMIRGAYHFLEWAQDPVKQADYFYGVLKQDPGELPPICDYEWKNPPSNASDILYRFLQRTEQLFGRVPILYTSWGFWSSYGNNNSWWLKYPLWLAQYNGLDRPNRMPKPWTDFLFWQFSSTGDGHKFGCESLGVDMDWFNGTMEQLVKFAGMNQPPTPAELTRDEKLDIVWREAGAHSWTLTK